ncbi:MAG: hypothetical protein K2N51_02485 [Lachnospiraceae bacterium]|nr:hypothetical protein [Lachnospiraceae bacterium]
MGRHKVWRYGALAMAAVLGFGTIFSGNAPERRVKAEDDDTATMVFAEGYGTGNGFSESSWKFAGKQQDPDNNAVTDIMTAGSGKAPGIEADNKYLKNGENVIRLVNGVKAQSDRSTGLEDSTSYNAYRSGEAFLKNGIKLKQDAEFSAKFTFSMPEAVVNTEQTKGEQGDGRLYAREVGGDGIAFVMTTNPEHETQAGSGIGYQGIDNSVAVELDSYFNGAYYMPKAANNGFDNWDFDNQLFLHQGVNTPDGEAGGKSIDENYQNPNFAERFDHIAITRNGDVKTHLAKYYMNNLDPTELVDGEYVNLANRYKLTNHTTEKNVPRKTGSTEESDSPDCATRFADKGVDTRLFTVWIDYADNKMDVSIANGDFVSAVKPATPQITNTVNLDNFDGQVVYMGFTSAVGSSKANHTIHSFSFSNVVEATYKLNYYLKDKTTGEYKLDNSTDIYTGEVGTTATAESIDSVYKDAYKDKNYELSTTKDQETSVKLEEKGKLYEMNLYYDPAEAYYKLNYWVYNTDKKEYEKKETSKTVTDYVGTKATINDIDDKYASKYPNYKVNQDKKDKFEVTLTEAGETYEMDVYYDPEQAGYRLDYHKLNPKTGKYEFIESSETSTGLIGKEYEVTDVDKNYKTKYEKDGYVINESKNEEYSVKIEKEDEIYVMHVYYDPAEVYYQLQYHLLDPKTGEYVLQEKDTTAKETGYIGTEKKVTDVDPVYGTKYPGYAVNTEKGKNEYSVKLEKAGETYIMHVYYDPLETPAYKLNYWKKNPNTGKYEYQESTQAYKGELDHTYVVEDADKDYKTKYEKDNYEINPDKNETYSVDIKDADKVYEMDVYYDPIMTTYKTEYYLKQPDGSYKKVDTIQGEKTYPGTSVTAPEKSYDGYVHVTTPDSKESAVVEADGSTTMKVYFDPKEKPTYKVEYYVEQPDGSYKLYKENKDIPEDPGTKVDAEIINIPGYKHTTTTNTKESGVVLEDSSTVLKVYYDLPRYKVEYYVEQPDGSYQLYTEKKDIRESAGTKVDAEIISIPGYEHTTTSNTNENDVVQADSSTVLKVYYNLVVEPTPTPTEDPNAVGNDPTDEPVEPEETPEPEETEEPIEPGETEEPLDIDQPRVPVPKTNDDSHPGAYFALMLSSIAVFVLTLLEKKKENDK